MKKIVAGIVVVTIAVFIWILMSVDERIKDHIERTASTLAGVPVTIDSVELSAFQGTGEINGLLVANPKGYSQGNAFEMNSIRFDIDLGTMFKQPLIVNELMFNSPVVNLEFKDNYQSNLQDILDVSREQNKAEANSEKSKTNTPQDAEAGSQASGDTQDQAGARSVEETSDGDYFRMVFQKLEINDIAFSAKRGDDEWSDALPAISMKNLGADDGIGTRALGITIVRKLAKQTLEQAARRKLSDAVQETVKELGNKLLESLIKD